MGLLSSVFDFRKKLIIVSNSVFFFSFVSSSAQDLSLVSRFQFSPDPLTTEMIWKLDPDWVNAHRQFWLVTREVQWVHLKAEAQGTQGEKKQYRVTAHGLSAFTQAYLRHGLVHKEKWMNRASLAAQLWEETLKQEKIKLEMRVSKITAETQEVVLFQAGQLLEEWLKGAETQWKQVCHQKIDSSLPEESPPKENNLKSHHLLMNIPLKILKDSFFLPLKLNFMGKTLTGHFLIDFSSKKSSLFFDYLKNQGFFLDWKWEAVNGTFKRKVQVSQVAFKELSFNLSQFEIISSWVGPGCESDCPGVLGALGLDFLKLYPTEFVISQNEPQLRFWSREGSFSEREGWSSCSEIIEALDSQKPSLTVHTKKGPEHIDSFFKKPNFLLDLGHGMICTPK